MEPSEAYAPIMEHVKVKFHLAKVVIEFVLNNEEAAYEDMLNKIQVRLFFGGGVKNGEIDDFQCCIAALIQKTNLSLSSSPFSYLSQ